MSNELAIALTFLFTLILAFLGWKNSRTAQENAELFQTTGELKATKYLVTIFLALASLGSLLAVAGDHHRPTDVTWPMSLIGLLGVLFVWIRSFFGVRLESGSIRFGWRLRRVVEYSDIVELERRSDGREAVFRLVLRSGERRRIGSSLSCEKMFIDKLQRCTGCKVTYRLGSRVVPEPEWLTLQSSYEQSKSRTSQNDSADSK